MHEKNYKHEGPINSSEGGITMIRMVREDLFCQTIIFIQLRIFFFFFFTLGQLGFRCDYRIEGSFRDLEEHVRSFE